MRGSAFENYDAVLFTNTSTYKAGIWLEDHIHATSHPQISKSIAYQFFLPQYDPRPLPRRALIAVTSAHAPLYPDGKETGLFITEALHPYNIFKSKGFEVDFVSETGTFSPDWLSTTEDWLKGDDKKTWEDTSKGFRKQLDSMAKAGDVDPDQYGLFFASAGHASLIDYPEALQLQRLASKVYSDGGIVSAVCHGGAIFPNVLNPVTNQSIINNKKVTGFTTRGEEEQGVLDTIKSWNRPTIEEAAAKAGGTYVSPPGPWDSFTQTDGRIVTGANPASAEATAVAAVEAFEKEAVLHERGEVEGPHLEASNSHPLAK